jgi:predicted aspartyl protease
MYGRRGSKVAINVSYDGAHGYVTNRPYADIFCHGVSGRTSSPFHLAALIDTGADYLELPTAVATSVGVNLGLYPTHTVVTAGAGTASVVVVSNFSVDIEGKLVAVTAHFLSGSTALLGLRAILSAVDFGLEVSRWLYKL